MEPREADEVREMRRQRLRDEQLGACPYTRRPDIPEPPKHMQALPIDKRGYPVPWFVRWIDGAPEFRAMDMKKFVAAINERRCWTCGNPLFREEVFVIGPMCAVNRISSEPPSHRECAEYSARACPFLSRPHMVRREDGLPGEKHAAGIMVARNPGVTLLWFTRRHTMLEVSNGVLFKLGEPFRVDWYKEGRPATRAEVMASIESGLPALREACDLDPQPGAHEALETQYSKALFLVPGK
jgi:hypothetical protein